MFFLLQLSFYFQNNFHQEFDLFDGIKRFFSFCCYIDLCHLLLPPFDKNTKYFLFLLWNIFIFNEIFWQSSSKITFRKCRVDLALFQLVYSTLFVFTSIKQWSFIVHLKNDIFPIWKLVMCFIEFGNNIIDLPWPNRFKWSPCKYTSHYHWGLGYYYFSINVDILFQENFFNCYLAALRPSLGHYHKGSLSHSMLITSWILHI